MPKLSRSVDRMGRRERSDTMRLHLSRLEIVLCITMLVLLIAFALFLFTLQSLLLILTTIVRTPDCQESRHEAVTRHWRA
jgi:hypothetical protein